MLENPTTTIKNKVIMSSYISQGYRKWPAKLVLVVFKVLVPGAALILEGFIEYCPISKYGTIYPQVMDNYEGPGFYRVAPQTLIGIDD